MSIAPSQTHADVAALADALHPVLLRLSRRLRRQAQQFGMSSLDAMLLTMVRKRPGVGVSELADLEHMSRPTMSAHVKRLEAAGWIARQAPDSDDKRRVGLTVTPAGARAVDAVRRQRADWLADRLETLSPDALQAVRAALGPLGDIAGERS